MFSSQAPLTTTTRSQFFSGGPLTSSHDLSQRALFTRGPQGQSSLVSCFLCLKQSAAEVLSHGSQITFSGEPEVSSGQGSLNPPDGAYEVVISPGLPTPPLSPFHTTRLPSGAVKVSLILHAATEAEQRERGNQLLLHVESQSITCFLFEVFSYFGYFCLLKGVRVEWRRSSHSQLWIILRTITVPG